MDDWDYRLLTWLESGHPVFQSAEPTDAARQEFQRTAARVLKLRERGLIHVVAAHISRTGAGDYLRIGPCVLSADGKAALVSYRQLRRRDNGTSGP